MNKPTIFFSHSSKDSTYILKLKNMIQEKTIGAIEIFMSSDGQSIPFGSNWVHKIEQGLRNASVMFVFVTPTSITSNWIYFEAGYAYAKGIEVIPVGVGIDIGQTLPPLSLLQGFNITNGDTLNNFISSINRKYELSIKESFIDEDYKQIMKSCDIDTSNEVFERFCNRIYSSIHSYMVDGKKEEINKEECIKDIYNYFFDKKVQVCKDDKDSSVLIPGLNAYVRQKDGVNIDISIYDFNKNFLLLEEIAQRNYKNKAIHWIRIIPNEGYGIKDSSVDISSIIKLDEDFSLIKEATERYRYKNIIFKVEANKEIESNKKEEVQLLITFDLNDKKIDYIPELVEKLYGMGIIYIK